MVAPTPVTSYSFPHLHFDFSSPLSFNSNYSNYVLWVNFGWWLHFVHQEGVTAVPMIAVRPVFWSQFYGNNTAIQSCSNPDDYNHSMGVPVNQKQYCVVVTRTEIPGQILQHFPSVFIGWSHGYWPGHVIRLQSWRPSLQVHRMHSRTFPRTGCHTSPWEYVLPLYKQAESSMKNRLKPTTQSNTRGNPWALWVTVCTQTVSQMSVSPLQCFFWRTILTVVSEPPLRCSLARLSPLGVTLAVDGVPLTDRSRSCSAAHWSTECLWCIYTHTHTNRTSHHRAILASLAIPMSILWREAMLHVLYTDVRCLLSDVSWVKILFGGEGLYYDWLIDW